MVLRASEANHNNGNTKSGKNNRNNCKKNSNNANNISNSHSNSHGSSNTGIRVALDRKVGVEQVGIARK